MKATKCVWQYHDKRDELVHVFDYFRYCANKAIRVVPDGAAGEAVMAEFGSKEPVICRVDAVKQLGFSRPTNLTVLLKDLTRSFFLADVCKSIPYSQFLHFC